MSECPTEKSPGTILFVEDELLIRAEMAELLREFGYFVHEASSATEALIALQSNAGFDLLLTDLNLPQERKGLEIVDWVARNRPGVKVVIATGISSWELPPIPVAGVLAKPYLRSELLERVRQALVWRPNRTTNLT